MTTTIHILIITLTHKYIRRIYKYREKIRNTTNTIRQHILKTTKNNYEHITNK